MYRIIFCLGLSLLSFSKPALVHAATGKKVQAEPTIITHKVTGGETLYSLSRKYGVSVADISKLNPATKAGLKVGQTLRIPAKKTESALAETTTKPVALPVTKPVAPVSKFVPETTATSKPKPVPAAAATSEASGLKIHKVGPKQTLYSVAVMHGVTMADIRKWNNLKTDQLAIGQELTVSAADGKPLALSAETPAPIVVKNEAKAKSEKTKNEIKTEVKTETPVTVAEAKTEDEEAENSSVEAAGKVTETGLAEVIAQAGENNKYLALHKTAPIGTILQVKNIMNGQNVYVRVIGKLPETGANENTIVRISKKAYQRLAAIDNRFRVEVSYMP